MHRRVKTETGSVYEFFEGKVRRVGQHDLRRDGEWLNILAMAPWKIGEPLVMKLEPLGEGPYTIRTTSRITAIE